ncbi:ATP-binding protein [Phaeovulum sp.]|uniref:ATP-binding protein n=1 Tax=Phaeovulum sp. TaxID=2934796 RepID=UPI0039E3CCCF
MTLMVGGISIAVNRHLIKTNDAMMARSLPAVDLASRIGASADLVGSLAASFVNANAETELDRAAKVLADTVAGIHDDMAKLQSLIGRIATPDDSPPISTLVTQMTADARDALILGQSIAKVRNRLDQQAQRLSLLLAQQLDLARLRITSAIADLYMQDGSALRPRLDRMADDYFFSFERIGELVRAADLIRILTAQMTEAETSGAIDTLAADLTRWINLADQRIDYLPMTAAKAESRALLQDFRAALGTGGVAAEGVRRAQALARIGSASAQLHNRIQALAQRAQALRQAAQRDNIARVTAATKLSERLSVGLFIAVGIAVLLSALLRAYVRRQLVQRMANVSRRIIAVARGDNDTPISISGNDEIGRMEKALNILRRRAAEAARLRNRLEEAVIARTGDILREMHDSNAARAEAETANLRKSQFLARMSHEIRTPLNGFIGMLNLLVLDEQRPDERARLHVALESARNLLEITNDILTFASAGEEQGGSTDVHFFLRKLIGQLALQLEALAGAKGLTAVVDLAEDAPPVLFGDLVKIRQVVTNLISNAVKYTPSGRVSLLIDHARDPATGAPVLAFTVADTGVGMTRAAADRAFDAYSRAASARRAGVEGAGLGLAISRRLTEQIGGALDFESAPGVGSRFTLTVPLKVGDPARIEEAQTVVPLSAQGRSVLVIEDHPVNRMVARGFLERMGCRVTEAVDAAAGLRAAKAQHFDLLLIDLGLPDMPGEALIAKLREVPGQGALVALTAHLLDDSAESRAALGVSVILTKPLSPRALAEVLSGLSTPGPQTPAAAPPEVLAALQSDLKEIGAAETEAIVRAFLEDLPAALHQIETAPPDGRRRAAHRLKGAAANFRLTEFCTLLARLEMLPGALSAADLTRLRAGADATRNAIEAAAVTAGLQPASGATSL